MNPKEKAKQLVTDFRIEIYKGVITTADFNPIRDAQRKEVAKRNAILCANEIIKDAEENWRVDQLNYEQSQHCAYWTEVIIEINNL